MSTDRRCPICAEPVTGFALRVYCTPACRDEASDRARRARAEEYECPGCGGTFRRQQPSHTGRCMRCSRARGSGHHMYRGGLHFNKALNRWTIYCRDGTNVLYYRAVMEAHLGRPLDPREQVHHINGDSTDDRIENLTLIDIAEHARLHARQRREVAA